MIMLVILSFLISGSTLADQPEAQILLITERANSVQRLHATAKRKLTLLNTKFEDTYNEEPRVVQIHARYSRDTAPKPAESKFDPTRPSKQPKRTARIRIIFANHIEAAEFRKFTIIHPDAIIGVQVSSGNLKYNASPLVDSTKIEITLNTNTDISAKTKTWSEIYEEVVAAGSSPSAQCHP